MVVLEELGLEEEDYSNQWVHFDIDEVDVGQNFERHEFDGTRPSIASTLGVVPCIDGFRRGVGLVFPVGTIPQGFYRISVEKGYTVDNEEFVCSTVVGFAEYGCGEFIGCE